MHNLAAGHKSSLNSRVDLDLQSIFDEERIFFVKNHPYRTIQLEENQS
jgi:hypothetical protein